MIFKQTIIAGISMFLLSIPLRSEVVLNHYNNTLTVSSTTLGVEGYHGCEVESATKIPAYVFELQTQGGSKSKKNIDSGTCSARGLWKTVSKKESDTKDVVFDNIPEGKYRVIVLSGQAIGCLLSGDTGEFPNKAIVYQREVSTPVHVGNKEVNREIDLIGQHDLFKVFPNPVSNELNIELQSTTLQDEVSISLVNLLGQTVQTIEQAVDQNIDTHNWKMNVQDYSPGAYFINLQDKAGKRYSQKIIIQHKQ